jgi:uncharacterized membrane protein YdjX (TVP38/TMEM64 family)
VSPSKKANKQNTDKKKKNPQKSAKKTSAGSSRTKNPKASSTSGKMMKQKNTSAKSSAAKKSTTKEIPATKKTETPLKTNLLRGVALLAVIGITVYIYSIRHHVEEFEQFGYAGVFLIALMANATVLLPAPGVAIIYAMGAVFNPLWVGIAAGTGGAIGELSGYLAGFSGQAVVERSDIYNRFKPWVDKHGGWAILVLSAIPNPFFDIAGIAAGIAKMPLRTFLFFTWIGQIIKMTLFAIAGYYSLTWLTNFFD